MRVALYGNVANNFFQLARALREVGGIDAHLFLDQRDGPTTRPESDDPTLASRYPDWIHLDRYVTAASLVAPWGSRLARELSAFDLVLASGFGPVFAPFTGRPWCFYTTGGDLTTTPFPLRFWSQNPRLRTRAPLLVVGAWQRYGVRRATEVWTQRFFPFQLALHRLRVDPARVTDVYLPVIFDAGRFAPRPNAREQPTPLTAPLVRRSDFIVFHPSRLIMRDDPRMRETGQWKANDRMIEGFAELVRRRPGLRPLLVMPDREHSPDVQPAKRLVERLGIRDSVAWLRPPDPRGFTRHELAQLYAVADVVPDDFGVGWFGAVVLEAMSMEVPVVSYVDEAVMATLYPWHPIIGAQTVGQIADVFTALADDPEMRRSYGRRGREWVLAFHSYSAAASAYVREVRRVLDAGRRGPGAEPAADPGPSAEAQHPLGQT